MCGGSAVATPTGADLGPRGACPELEQAAIMAAQAARPATPRLRRRTCGMLLSMTRWYRLERPDPSTFTEGSHVYRYPARFAASVERVWESLTSDESVKAWGLGVQALRWTSPRPFGVGSTREVTLPLRTMTVREEFFRWDEGKGYSFYVTEANRRGLRSFAENYELEPDGDGTLFTWTIALEPTTAFAPALRLLAPVNRVAFGQLVRGGKRYFSR
jgi:hypothetical protein